MLRPLTLALVLAAAWLALPASAHAAPGQVDAKRALQEMSLAEAGIARALDAAERGDRRRAYDEARAAYLDHFELAEIPLRLRDPSLVLDTEFAFAQLRNGVRAGEPLDQTRATVRQLRSRLDQVRRTLADPGFAGPLLAFGFAFSILFREGVEAVLLIAVLLGSLEAGRASNFRRPLGWGVLAAVLASALTWVLATLVIDIAPLDRELLEAVTALAAVVVLVVVSFWLISQLEQRRRMEFMRARVAGAMAAGTTAAFAGLGFTAVYREGFETVLFYQALTLFADGLLEWVALGAAAGGVALAAVGYAILRAGRRLPLKPMLTAGASILLVLSVAFAGNAVRSLQEGDWLPITPVASGWARLPVFAAELTGIHPTREGLLTQAVLLAIFVVGALYVFAWRPLRRRRATSPATA